MARQRCSGDRLAWRRRLSLCLQCTFAQGVCSGLSGDACNETCLTRGGCTSWVPVVICAGAGLPCGSNGGASWPACSESPASPWPSALFWSLGTLELASVWWPGSTWDLSSSYHWAMTQTGWFRLHCFQRFCEVGAFSASPIIHADLVQSCLTAVLEDSSCIISPACPYQGSEPCLALPCQPIQVYRLPL